MFQLIRLTSMHGSYHQLGMIPIITIQGAVSHTTFAYSIPQTVCTVFDEYH